MSDLGDIEEVNPREVWPHEASDFTPWLAANLKKLGDALGMELELTTVEAPVGEFSLDLLAKDLNGNRAVIIENQLNATDHDHLGKLLTYASGHNASVVIWIAPQIREEHRQALDWLNQRTDASTEFFGVQLRVIRIDSSRPAVQFRAVASPNSWSKEVGASSSGASSSGKGAAYQAFLQVLVDEMREKHRFTNARRASATNWYSFSSGTSGIGYNASFAQGGRIRAEIYIDLGEESLNKKLFDELFRQREALEAAFGGPLSWERLDSKRASRIAIYREGSIEASPEDLGRMREWFVIQLMQLKKIFGGPIAQIVDRLYG